MLGKDHKVVFPSTNVYGMKVSQIAHASTSAWVVWHVRADHHLAMETALSGSAGVLQLSSFKSCRLITLSMDPHRKNDPDPHIRQCPYSDGMAFPLRSLALIVVLRPRFTLSALPRKMMQGVAQRFDAPQPAMRFGVHATLIEDRRGPSQRLQTTCIKVSFPIISNLSQQAWSQAFARTWQARKDGVILMGQKKGVDLLVIVGDLLNQGQQLADQGQQQARFCPHRGSSGLQLRLRELLNHGECRRRCLRMSALFEQGPDLINRCSSCLLWGGIGLQENQRAFLLHLPKQLQRHGIIRFQASRDLIDQACLHLDQGSLITGQHFQLGHLFAIWGQTMQISKVSTPSFGQQIRIDQVCFGSRGRSAPINCARINGIDKPSSIQEESNQQAMSGLDNAGHLVFRRCSNNLLQKCVQFVQSLCCVIDPKRTHLMSFFIQGQCIMVLVSPINTGIPHQKRSSLQKMLLRSRALILWRSKRRLSHNRFGSGMVPGKTSFPNRSSRVERRAFPWRVQHI